jgi:hypothetical protein
MVQGLVAVEIEPVLQLNLLQLWVGVWVFHSLLKKIYICCVDRDLILSMGAARGQAGREDRRAVRVIAKGGGRERAATACLRWPWAERPGARHGVVQIILWSGITAKISRSI